MPATRGAMRFRNSFTGNPMADYLLGYVADLQLSNVWVVQQRHSAQMFFVQDDWKATSRLSVNLGLRYDYMTPALEANNAQTNFIPTGSGSRSSGPPTSPSRPVKCAIRPGKNCCARSSPTRASIPPSWSW